ncbi:cytoplasmic tRNA 2-thiolation protein 2 [Blastomyces dermatitidis]|uniref:Cytoplasmic tRNA 2-thiolation protein 2 n=4 Tax=Blastomyces TaxID=229219 RepID=A0A179UXY0_BLAGS|nr:cytoplasmic tRNA 2-thiolation protein 2 [Blastomyces gilchristii SLH14081]XP_045276841.1 cytoplasmic tRNA 2-thiolation protein 2 [Blastomyces dermatitidis ER-3]EEQ90027.1 cytoplasmic tRNA 2-thiolation protein 2 [Blastomyces dermatitidis ER-3]EQL37697.1 cytoplasmic tRNA 2-thiolation protein 2 [Blastomyces dermatitidis ATCC 26199]OAT12946.1 cytoplasmic tRNA 2-thiolation protein 2 [Blastomyces gilchristii SLH14081]
MAGKAMGPCLDCKVAPATQTVRKRDLCQQCFFLFIGSKVVKRMEKYRPRNAEKNNQRKFLLPLSYGVSSSTLLHILNLQLERQISSGLGRRTYEIHVLNVGICGQPDNHRLDLFCEAYPLHTYTQVPLHSIFKYDTAIEDIISEYGGPEFRDDQSKMDQERLDHFRLSLSTAAARTDIDGILLTRLVVAIAKELDCDAILWGDSDTRLASKALSNVAKGRGFSAPWDVCDGMTPWGIQFNFPMRDVLKFELSTYASLALPKSLNVVDSERPSVDNLSSKNLSIEDLLAHYVETQGEKYPGIMANIVRTIDKLQAPAPDTGYKCVLCGMPVDMSGEDPSALGGSGGSQYVLEDRRERPMTGTLCYGCARTRLDLVPPKSTPA